MEPGIYGTDGTDPRKPPGVLEPRTPSTAPARRARRPRHRLVAAGAAVGGRRLGDHGGRGVGGREPGRPAGPRAARPASTTRATASATPPTPTASCSTTRSATCGPAGSSTPTTAGRPTPTTSCGPGTQGIDGAAASAEEAAVHVVREPELRSATPAAEPSTGRPARLASDCTAAGVTGVAMGKPVLLSVDDDPGVSRAVARDLRRRYGEDYRVLRASSAAEALEALRELKLRGDPVAVLLADYRMPRDERHRVPRAGDGPVPAGPPRAADRLRRHRRRHPGDQRRRRRRLPAQAVGPAGGEALPDRRRACSRPWRETPRRRRSRTSSSSATAGRRRRSGRATCWPATPCPYRWYSVDEPEGQRLLAAAGAGPDDVPVVVTPDAQVLLHPSESELAAVAGLSVDPREKFYDLVVVGGGPAGLGAAVYGASEGLRTVLVEREATGGQAGQSSRIENYLGFPDGVSGGQLAERARRQAAKFGAELLLTRDVVALEAHGPKRVRAARRRQRDRRARRRPGDRGLLPQPGRRRRRRASPGAASTTARP